MTFKLEKVEKQNLARILERKYDSHQTEMK